VRGRERDRPRPERPALRVPRLRAADDPARADPGRHRPRPARLLRARRHRLPRLPHGRLPPYHGRPRRRPSGPGGHRLPAARGRRQVALSGLLVPPGARAGASAHHGAREPALMAAVETTDVVVIGTGFGGAIPGYYLAAAGARVVMLERGPRLATEDFTHNLQLGTFTRIVDDIRGDGVDVIAGNCVGGSSVIYFAASLRAPSFVFERTGTLGRRLWPPSISRPALDR